MTIKKSVDPSVFVVSLHGGAAIGDRMETLQELGDVELMKGYTDRCLLRVESTDDPKATWQRLRDRLGPDFDVEPAFVDDRGDFSYPTGTVTVRFEKTPTDDELEQCEQQWSMRVKARNQYVPNQVTFEKTAQSVGEYLPDVIESINRNAKRVRAAWPDTVSKYRRS